jgi:hypothetical protein
MCQKVPLGFKGLILVGPDRAVHQSRKCRMLHCQFSYSAQAASVVYWSEPLAIDPEVPDSISVATSFLRSSVSGTGSTQPREDN